ncbi:MAG: hypothetical protein K2L88_05780 [Clostridiales bacterium]|nr:hypothetical protein [Clostridiales bacterium]
MKKRYELAMRQDFPKDFVSDDEWDFIESMAAAKGDGVKNKSITACRMPKSGGVKNMARQQNNNQPARTVQEKCDYYSRRVNDPKLTEGQRNFALRRLNSLCGGSSKGQSPKSTKTTTVQQNNARMAGIGYGVAKEGGRVPIQPENRDSFRGGVQEGRALAKKNSAF